MKFLFLFIFLFFSYFQSQANTLTEDFSTVTNKNSSTLIWNTALTSLHAPLQIANYQAPAQSVMTSPIPLGDGHHGDFGPATYTNFGTLSSGTLTIDATLFPALEVKSFTLDNATTLTVVNGPLIVRSLSTVQIDGVINCKGANGSPAVGATGGSAGLGRCGGQNGGAGGNTSASGANGIPFSGVVSGGRGGVFAGAAPGAGGGGGGAYAGNPGSAGTNSNPATNTGGLGGNGASGANHQFTVLNGSPGGGGGSGSNTQGGGGGGGGGGTVIIYAVGNITISATGFILAQGGNGGAANNGGGGGGGGGGGVNLFTPAEIHLDSGIPIDVSGGGSGVSTSTFAGDGGTGSFGRIWDVSATFSGTGSESHGSGLLQTGDVQFQVASFSAVTNSFDSSSDSTIYNSLTTTSVDPGISLEIAGSSDNFSSDNTGWIAAALVNSINLKRYFKLRLSLNNSSPTNLFQINDVAVGFTLPPPPPPPPPPSGVPPNSSVKTENFEFKSGCGRVSQINPEKNSLMFFIFLLMMPVIVLIRVRLKALKSKI